MKKNLTRKNLFQICSNICAFRVITRMQRSNSKTFYIEYFASIRNKSILKVSLDKKALKLRIIYLVFKGHLLLNREFLYKLGDLLYKLD